MNNLVFASDLQTHQLVIICSDTIERHMLLRGNNDLIPVVEEWCPRGQSVIFEVPGGARFSIRPAQIRLIRRLAGPPRITR